MMLVDILGAYKSVLSCFKEFQGLIAVRYLGLSTFVPYVLSRLVANGDRLNKILDGRPPLDSLIGIKVLIILWADTAVKAY